MSRIENILRAIIDNTPYTEVPQSRVEEILLAIKNDTQYSGLLQSRIEEILSAIKNNTSYDKLPMSRIEEILIAKLKNLDYTKLPQSRIEELLIEWLVHNEPVLNLTSKKGVTSSGKNAVQFVFKHVIPADYEIIEVGIIYGSNKQVGADTSIEGYQTANLTVDGATYGVNDVETVVKTMSNPNVKKLVAEYTNNNGKLTLSYGIGSSFDAYVNAIGYVTYRNDGQEGTLYSNFIATTYNLS